MSIRVTTNDSENTPNPKGPYPPLFLRPTSSRTSTFVSRTAASGSLNEESYLCIHEEHFTSERVKSFRGRIPT